MTRAGLPPMDVAGRIPRLRERFDGARIDALLVTRMVNVRYLTGFTGSAALLLVGPDDVLFVTDGRYRDQSAEQLAAADVEARVEVAVSGLAQQRDLVRQAADRYLRVGLEAHGVTWAQQRAYADEWFPDGGAGRVVPTEGLVEDMRRVKDDGERARVAAACSIADRAFAGVRSRLADRPTEREFALELEFAMRRLGAEAVSFDPIVASGPNGAKPHARPGDRRIDEGETVVLDFGCVVDGYCSDMTRTLGVGDPGPEARKVYDVVFEAQAAGRAAVRDGVEAAAVDAACREIIAAAGWGDAFLHGTGHGVGLEIHEAPRLAATSGDTLAAGHVVTIEPGVYRSGLGGVRIEDTVLVTAEACEVLTHTPKDLML